MILVHLQTVAFPLSCQFSRGVSQNLKIGRNIRVSKVPPFLPERKSLLQAIPLGFGGTLCSRSCDELEGDELLPVDGVGG